MINYAQPKVEELIITQSYGVINPGGEIIDIKGKNVYKVTCETEDDPLLGPITVYIGQDTFEILGTDIRR